MGHVSSKHRMCALIGTVLVAAGVYHAAAQTTDGLLDEEVSLILADANGNGIPDILETGGPRGLVIRAVDERADGSVLPRDDGFRDAGLRPPVIPTEATDPACTPDVLCYDIATFPGQPLALSGVNIGRIFAIYVPDPEGDVDPGDFLATDQSYLYVGIDIPSGDKRTIVGDLGEQPIDFMDINDFGMPGYPNGVICDEGIADYDYDNTPDFYGVPFDVDADGNPRFMTRWFSADVPPACTPASEFTDDDTEHYTVSLYACGTPALGGIAGNRFAKFDLVVEEGETLILLKYYDEDVAALQGLRDIPVPPELLLTVQTFPPYTTPGDEHNDFDLIGQGPLDVEFLIPHIDTYLDLAWDTPYEIDRLRFLTGGIVAFGDTNGDSISEDRALTTWSATFGSVEARQQFRRFGETEADWTADAAWSAGTVVEFRLEVENTGTSTLDVVLEDTLQAVGCALGLEPVRAAIRDGGNGLAETFAMLDDIQLVPFGEAVTPGGVVILPGPNGVVNSTPQPGADDTIVSTTMTVTLFRPSDAIVDNGNGIVQTVKAGDDIQLVPPGQPVLPGGAIIFPGANGILDTPPGPEIQLPRVRAVIIDGGNGIADTLRYGDDVQLVAQGAPVAPGQPIIGPGPNGVIDTTPAGDDFQPQTESVLDGGNEVVETVAVDDDLQIVPVGEPAAPGQLLVLPGPDGDLQTTPGGDDQRAAPVAPAPVNFGNAAALGFDEAAFFGPNNDQFLYDISAGTATHFGALTPFDVCDFLRPGDRVVITFLTVVSPEGFCPGCPGSALDFVNAASTSATYVDWLTGETVLLQDEPGVIDTPREFAQGFDDNVTLLNTTCPGDVNCDGLIDDRDIGPFVLALSRPEEFEAQLPDCDILNADMNGDGVIDLRDINPLARILAELGFRPGTPQSPQPKPSAEPGSDDGSLQLDEPDQAPPEPDREIRARVRTSHSTPEHGLSR